MADYDLSPTLGLELPIKGNGAPFSQNVLRSNFSKIDADALATDTALSQLNASNAVAVSSDAERDLKFPAPVQGNRVWRTDRLCWEMYYGLFNFASNPYGNVAAGWLPFGVQPSLALFRNSWTITTGNNNSLTSGGQTVTMAANYWPKDKTQGNTQNYVKAPWAGMYEVTANIQYASSNTTGVRNLSIASGSKVDPLGDGALHQMNGSAQGIASYVQTLTQRFRVNSTVNDMGDGSDGLQPIIVQNTGGNLQVTASFYFRFLGPAWSANQTWGR